MNEEYAVHPNRVSGGSHIEGNGNNGGDYNTKIDKVGVNLANLEQEIKVLKEI